MTGAVKHQPGTALPWKIGHAAKARSTDTSNDYLGAALGKDDQPYIVHSANAYGPLVLALKAVMAEHRDGYGLRCADQCNALLRQLGELEMIFAYRTMQYRDWQKLQAVRGVLLCLALLLMQYAHAEDMDPCRFEFVTRMNCQ